MLVGITYAYIHEVELQGDTDRDILIGQADLQLMAQNADKIFLGHFWGGPIKITHTFYHN